MRLITPSWVSRLIFCFLICLLPHLSTAQAGKNGAKSINGTVSVNEYTTLATDASAGATSITVANTTLNTNGYFSGPLAAGDLIFLIQIQGVNIGSADDTTYGAIQNYNNCGHYEFAEVVSVPNSSTINIACTLQKNYSTSGRTLIVRVPRYTTLTVNGGGTLTCPAWNGSTGGVLVLEVQANTSINSGGKIDVSGKGFRGGALLENNATWGVLNYRDPQSAYGGEKGESVFGYQADYDAINGRYCKGAPANGGGGASAHNGGGGGGSNAGSLAGWTGRGNPDVSTGSWASAWNLEYTGFASSTSSGGGKGGYTFSSSDQNALSVGTTNSAWGGDARRDNGGRGARPLDYSGGRLFLGGGGGGGDQNDNYGGAGGAGGGIAYLMVQGDIFGSGQILANGANGSGTVSTGTDGSGGGGAGGVIMLNVLGNISGVTANANGGNGGSQSVGVFSTEAEGPGGGGGGGYVAISNGAITRTANGGNNGTTNSRSLTEFPPNGATKGGAGISNATISNFKILPTTVLICGGGSSTITLTPTGTVPPGTIFYWYDQAVGGTLLTTGTSYTTPSLSANTTYYVGTCPGFYRTPIQVTVSAVTTNFTSSVACEGAATTFTATGSATAGAVTGWSWNFGDGTGTASQQNPSYTYTTAGSYTTTLTATDNNGCTASVSHTVTVSPRPTVSFTSSSTVGCGSVTINFTNNTTNANSYTWNFGDGTPSSSQTSPTHTYSGVGAYTVTLTASNSAGCTNTSSQTNLITIYPQPTASYSSNNNVCLGDTIYFTNLSNGNGGVFTSHSWNFGDGSPTSSQANPYHVFATAGNFSVQLTSNTTHCSDDTTITITIAPAPQVNFSSTPSNGCGPLAVNFTNTTTGSPVYSWNFGDGSPSTSTAAPSHTYSSAGTYSVTLIATQGSCADTLTIPSMITVYQKPTASFSSITTLCLGDTVFFTNASTGNGATITGYSWNFGDGSPASSVNQPYHVYGSAGNFSVVLTASTANCSDDSTRTISVNPAPVVSFGASSTSGCNPFTVSFTNTTTGSPAYTWNFGDGSPASSATTPSHVYASSGTYTVTLIATQGSCADTLVRTNYITSNPTPTASFTSNNNVCLGDTIFFANTSTGNGSPLNTYSWDFGDGSPGSSITNPYHVFATAGSFPVHLTSASANCSDDTTIQITVAPAPVVSFSAPVTSGCNPLVVNFSNATTGSPVYTWDFGDGSPSASSATPSHTYTTAGSYSVTLIAAQGSCSDTLVSPSMINVTAKPTASYAAPSAVCLGDTIHFTNLSNGNGSTITAYTWNFGDGSPSSSATQPSHLFSSAGNYSVTLTTQAGGCSDDTTIVIAVNPAPQVNFSSNSTTGCGPQTIQFTNATTGSPAYSWNFGDGSSLSTATNPSHLYSNSGTYTVTLIASQGSCGDTLVQTNMITIAPQPTAAFSASNVCLGDTVHFSNLSSGNGGTITSYSWNFGDGSPVNSLQNPAHLYTTSGSFTVTLSAATSMCSDDSTLSIVVSPAPQVQFSSSTSSGCSPVSVNFTNTTTGAPVYTWNFGDGSPSSSLTAPTHVYSSAGTYTVTLIATQGSCADTLSIQNMISVQSSPIAQFSASTPCFGDTLYFTNQSQPNGTSISGYTWNLGDGSPQSSQTDVAHYYNTAGSYSVTLITSGTGGCSDTATQLVNVLPRPTVTFSASTATGCDSLTVNFTNTTTGANTYHWSFGDGDTSALQSPSHSFTSPGSYTVGLTAQATGGCSATRAYVNMVIVRRSPIAQFASSASSICPGDCISFTDNSGTGITGWQWTFAGANPSSASVSNPSMVCYPNIGTYDVGLTVTDGYCSGSSTMNGMVHVVNCSQLPKANFISSDTGLCGGSCISFVSMSLNATSWQWSFPGASPSSSTDENPSSVCYSTPGNYSVVLLVSNASGSDSLRMINFIQVNPNPATPSFSQTGDTLMASPAAAYQWYFNGVPISGATSQRFIATLSGNYSVEITDGKGCTAISPVRYVALVGIEETQSQIILLLYPNPVEGQLNLLIHSGTNTKANVALVDALGQILLSRDIQLNSDDQLFTFDCTNFAPGLYWVRISSAGGSVNRKILIR